MTVTQLQSIYELPITTLIYKAQEVHHKYHHPSGVKLCSAHSIKTGACPEDCAYCPQSAHYKTYVTPEKLQSTEKIMEAARAAKESGASRMCLGGAWGKVPQGETFERLLASVRSVRNMGLEVCCSLGSVTEEQANQLKEAGCGTYNYNIDSSREFYPKIITTRSFDERLNTLKTIQQTGMNVCCGGIIGMGETLQDRMNFLYELTQLDPHPESIPLNALVSIPGTPLGKQAPVDSIEFVRMVATTRIGLPKSYISLAAGRVNMNEEMQTLCFLAGANSIIIGNKILVTGNPPIEEDRALLAKLGLSALEETAFLEACSGC